MEIIQAQYLACRPVSQIKWQFAKQDVRWHLFAPDFQQQMMEATVLHPWAQQYPASPSYRRVFLKHIISRLEEVGVEVCDEVYESYTRLLSQQTDEAPSADMWFKTYLLPDGDPIHLKESIRLVSQGTTGLTTWRAAQHLSEWCLEHPEVIQHKNVLELGSGLGLTGLVVCKRCGPGQFSFTYCHPQELELLAENIDCNIGAASKQGQLKNSQNESLDDSDGEVCQQCNANLSDSCGTPEVGSEDVGAATRRTCHSCGETSADKLLSSSPGIVHSPVGQGKHCFMMEYKTFNKIFTDSGSTSSGIHRLLLKKKKNKTKTRVVLLEMDWEIVTDAEMSAIGKDLDVILAADLVYDTSIIPALIRVLTGLLSSSQAVVYIASTIRSEKTRDTFLQALDEVQIQREIVAGPRLECFHYDRSEPFEILKLTLES